MSHDRLTPDECAAWEAIKRLSGQALAAVGRDIEAATGLSGADFGILTRIADLGAGCLSQADLLASLQWEKSRLSHQLTRMEARRLVARERSGRRDVTIHLLACGREQAARARPIHAQSVRRHVLRHIDAEDARVLARIVDRLSRA